MTNPNHMIRPYQICLSLCIMLLVAESNYAQKPVARDYLKQTDEEWLWKLSEGTRDSILKDREKQAYKEWKAAIALRSQKEIADAENKVANALADPGTTSLDLSYFPAAELDPRIASLKKLHTLTLVKCKNLDLTKLFDLLAKLPELRTLDLSDGGFSSLPSNVGNLAALDSFIFRNNNIKALPETFTKLKNLGYLNLTHNAYMYDDDLFDRLKQMNVRSLDLSSCAFFELNAKVGEVKSLRQLNLGGNDIKVLPATFSQLTSMERIDLSQNLKLNLSAISGTLAGVRSLTALYLDRCDLASLPTEIGSVSSLRVLSLRENILGSLPASISGLTHLEELYVGSPNNAFRLNTLESLPAGFGNLKKLRILDLSGNQFESLGNELGQLTDVEYLDLSRNQLSAVPSSVTNLSKLRFANFNRNKIAEVPAGLNKLTLLDSLFLDGDFFNKADKKIKALPDDICQLKNLKKLTVKDNVIDNVPACIDGMTSLVSLDLRGNNITQLPSSFTRLSHLQVLDLKSNDLQGLPEGFDKLPLTDFNIAMNLNAGYPTLIPLFTRIKTLRILDISFNNLTKEQLQPLIDGLPGCKIINVDYYNKNPLPTNTAPQAPRNNRPILDDGPKRNK